MNGHFLLHLWMKGLVGSIIYCLVPRTVSVEVLVSFVSSKSNYLRSNHTCCHLFHQLLATTLSFFLLNFLRRCSFSSLSTSCGNTSFLPRQLLAATLPLFLVNVCAGRHILHMYTKLLVLDQLLHMTDAIRLKIGIKYVKIHQLNASNHAHYQTI